MIRKILLFKLFFILSINIFSQVSINPDIVSVDYSNPKEYEIGGVTISGIKYLDQNVLIYMSGLSVGKKIMIPGDEITKAIKKFWKQGLFSDIQINATKIIGDKIFINIYLQERPRLSKFSFNGVSKTEADDLREDIKLIRGSQVTENVLINTKNVIKKYFIDKGFFNTEVNIVVENDTLLTNNVILNLNIDKHDKIKINEISFDGVSVLKEKKLRRAMKETKQKKWYRLFKASKFITDNFEEDKKKIIEKYNEKGYRDAIIVTDTVYSYDEKTLNIDIKVIEGSKYFFRNITWIGNTKYSSEYLNLVLGIKKGDIFDQSILNDKLFIAPDAVSSLYLDNGYLFFSIIPVEIMVENDSIDIEMQIYEGKQATINKIIVSGNTRTNDHVIRREIRSKPGQLFDRSDIIRSTRELAQLGYFDPEKLDVQPVPNPSDGTVDIEYILEEKPSDQIELSGGFGGGMVIGTLGLTFNNFSAKNVFNGKAWRPLPSGDGQKLMLRAQTNGQYYQAYSISFVEPWLGGKKPNSLSCSIYHTIRTTGTWLYENAQSMKVSGVSVGLGRRLKWPDDFFNLSHQISYQKYKLDNYVGYFIFSDGVSNNISITNTFARHSAGPNPLYPMNGSIFSLSLQITPPYSLFKEDKFWELSQNEIDNLDIGENENLENKIAEVETGNKYEWIEYHKWKFKSSWFISIVDKLVLNTKAEFGFIGYYDNNIGFSPFETFNLGGDGLAGYNLYGTETIGLRGYDNGKYNRGSLTPQYPKTGNIYDKFTVELRYPLTLNPSATIYALAFLEGGNAWYKFNDFNPFSVKRSAGVGVRLFLPMLGMLGVDWGYGFDEISWSPGSNKGQFAFIIGQQF
ncbi:MAG: outer membrane protein assembly factor BamA [Bacteroidales bacterium]|nr:outer membrane protein assembly factor BamA [Bacteroidales bacterium]